MFLIDVNDFSDDLTTNVKLIAEDTSPFSVVHNMSTSRIDLINDLNKIKNWANQWKMNFNLDPSKQAQEVIFSRKLHDTNHNQVYFNHKSVKHIPFQKYLRLYFDTKLNFQEHLNNVLSKVNKTFGLLHNLLAFLQCRSLVTVYKAFIRPHLDYGHIIYDHTYNDSFHQTIESIQYTASLAITGAKRCTAR